MPNLLFFILIILISTNLDIYLYKINILGGIPPTVLVLSLSIIVFILSKSRIRISKDQSFKFFIKMYSAVIILSLLFIPVGVYNNSENILQIVFLQIYSLILFILLYSIIEKKHIKNISLAIQFSFFVLLLSIFYDLIFPGSFSFVETRGAGFAENPNSAALRLIVLYSVLRVIRPKNIYYYSFFTIIGVIATLSRAGIIILFAIEIYFILQNSRIRRKNLSIIVLISIFFIGIFYIISEYSYLIPSFQTITAQKRIFSITNINAKSIKLDDRMGIISYYLNLAFEKPILGYGTAFTYNRSGYLDIATHNLYLRFFVEYGILGLSIIFLVVYNFFKLSKENKNMISFFIIFSIGAMFSNSFFETSFLCLFYSLAAYSFHSSNIKLT